MALTCRWRSRPQHQLQTLVGAAGTAASCHFQTHALQQTGPGEQHRQHVESDSRNGSYGMSADHSGLMLAARTTFAHFSVSSPRSLLYSAGESARGVLPRSTIRALIRGSARLALIARLSLSMSSTGVLRGTPTPWVPPAS